MALVCRMTQNHFNLFQMTIILFRCRTHCNTLRPFQFHLHHERTDGRTNETRHPSRYSVIVAHTVHKEHKTELTGKK